MTADPMPPSDGEVPDWLVPPPGGFQADDLDRMPNLPRHTELIDGSLVLVSPQAMFHMLVIRFLEQELGGQVPEDLAVGREMTVTLGRRQRPKPDLLILRVDSIVDLAQTTFKPTDVVLVVEVVSPDSVERDRIRKPQLYAEAGIPHLWRVESADGHAVVYVYELDPATGKYVLTGIHHDRLRLTVPFGIDLDLTQATRLKPPRG
ncbi:Uma2 family endonuclease [Nocardia sp. 2]|uniref:Uma2 family endonuclease n=1 Tax=Nocardia acididurans TaxID=2802282 RepID=A0ABS1M7V2_9NOCA|nr:Uma2 family endonuclease [Nocardia acididurans]MBL1076225.1 Uma2 family endonuclease [Nocardia acididurans]